MNTTATYPALTEAEFNAGCGYTFQGIPICEAESGDWVFAYGHVDKDAMARAVNEYDQTECGIDPEEFTYDANDVGHLLALTTKPADHPDGWEIRWGFGSESPRVITEDTPGAFPVTVVSR